MEDSVTENEKLQVVLRRSSKDYEDEKQGAAKEAIINGTEEKPPPAVGFINQLISNFTPAQGGGKQGEKQGKEDRSEEKEEEKRGGVFSHIVSNLVSSRPSCSRARDDKQAGKAGGDDHLMENANLPPPLPDDAAPASDEASILIHSIIHD